MNKYLPWRATLLIAAASLILVDIGYLEFGFPGLLLGWATYLWHVTQTEWRLWRTVLLSIPLVLVPLIGVWQAVQILGPVLLVIMIVGIVWLFGKIYSLRSLREDWCIALVPIALLPALILGAFSYGVWGIVALGAYTPLVAWWIDVWWKSMQRESEPQEEDDAEQV